MTRMSKDESPAGPPPSSGRGLLSKMVRFVRHPTVNWSEIDNLDEERESQYSKQMLKDMIERKRRNDFVRRREFDQLRKLRSREGARAQPEAEAEVSSIRTSLFQSSISSPDERADTLRKIDEIEAQMSHQWWKGRAGAAPAAAPAQAAPAAAPQPDSAAAQLSPAAQAMATALANSPFATGEHAKAFAPTAPLTLPPAADTAGLTQPAALEPSLAFAPSAPAPAPAAAAAPTAAPAAAAAPPGASFVHDPELEEAAIRFASADHAGAETALREVLARRERAAAADLAAADAAPAQQEARIVWLTLFDLFRATGQHEPFEALAIEYAARFHHTAPLWFSLPQQLGLPALVETGAKPAAAQRELSWNAPALLTAQSIASLQAALARAAQPWTLSWSRLGDIEPSVVPLLADLVERLADEPAQLRFVGVPQLQAIVQGNTPSGERTRDPQWWRLHMALLRLMDLPDEFELAALDYCVTYEVSPPSWVPPRCTFSGDAQALAQHGADADPLQGAGLDSYLPSMQSGFALSVPPGSEQGPVPSLLGVIEGDASAALQALQELMRPGVPLVVACDQLVRIDFAAGGGVLNWAASQQASGAVLEFRNLHRLVAVFFNVIGINEHARVVSRSD